MDPYTDAPCPTCGNVGKYIHATATSTVRSTSSAIPDLRYSFTSQFLCGAALFARRAREIEDSADSPIEEKLVTEHRAYVVAAIMQSVAALEAEIWEVLYYGPGYHLGTNGTDINARNLLQPQAEEIDKKKTLHRYKYVLEVLNKPPLDLGAKQNQRVKLLIDLRKELVHYKSKWGQKMERRDPFDRLKQLRFENPPFIPYDGTNFFPHQLLSSSCASWAVSTATEFLTTFYSLLALPSPLEPHKAALSVPPIRHRA